MIKAEIVADSITPSGCRLTTFSLEYPRYIHADFMTHRVFSRNASSSRACPTSKLIAKIYEDMEMPCYWGKNQAGMKSRSQLSNTRRRLARVVWKLIGYASALACQLLTKIGLHKQWANRIIEAFTPIKVIVSATDYKNFFMLRNHPDAMPELEILASKMQEAYEASVPEFKNPDEWHIPFGDKFDIRRLEYLAGVIESMTDENYVNKINELKIKIAIARCARISYLNHHGKDDYESDLRLFRDLVEANPKHLSPTEHVAMASGDDSRIGNFRGWKQYRKFIGGESGE